MSLVEDSHGGGNECGSPNCGHKGTINGEGGHSGNIGKDSTLGEAVEFLNGSPVFQDAVKFLKEVEEQW